MIRLKGDHIEAIRAHGEKTYPHECGGMLIGEFAADGLKTVFETFPLENSSEEDQRNRVLLLPKDVLRAEKYARENKLDVIGYYHSHPTGHPRPSATDCEHASGDLRAWAIVAGGEVAFWRDGEMGFEPLSHRVVDR